MKVLAVFLAAVLVACSTPRAHRVRVDIGGEELAPTRMVEDPGPAPPIVVPQELFEAEMVASHRQPSPLDSEYLRWCLDQGREGDCLSLLVDGPLDESARRRLALSFALRKVWSVAAEEMRETVDPFRVQAAILVGLTIYLGMLAVPEPITKAVAAAMTIALVSYLGLSTVWRIITEWQVLTRTAAGALTLEQLRGAGERFGAAMGAKAPRLPRFEAAAAMAPQRAGIGLGLALSNGGQAVRWVQVSQGQMAISLAPGALAMAAGTAVALGPGSTPAAVTGPLGFKSYGSFKHHMGSAGHGKEWHHIVEQTKGNVSRFGPERLHNTENVIALEEAVHLRLRILSLAREGRLQ